MKDTLRTKSGKTAKARKSDELDISVRIPEDFIFLLMDKLVSDLAEKPCESGDAPILCHPDIDLSGVHKAIRSRNIHQLIEATKPFSAQCIMEKWSGKPEIAFALYQIHTLLKKYPISGRDCEQAAYQAFLRNEDHCRLFNQQNYKTPVALSKRHPDYLNVLEELRAEIACCIGQVPPLENIYDGSRHGPGTAIGLSSPMVTNYFKWSSLPYTVSPRALPYAREAVERDPRWIGALIDSYRRSIGNINNPIDMDAFWSYVFKVVDYCEYSTVPKSAETDRSIGIEPVMNVFLQLGVDGVIRRRLRHRWGIDLNTQTWNQELAMLASVTDEEATLDLKAASDCVAMMACFLLLPIAWFDLLCDLRSENIRIDKRFAGGSGTTIPLQKISAMGNGFTFVLETLIFAAICRVTMRRAKIKGYLAVYGDDIIVPKAAAPKVIEMLDMFGFAINVEKSFVNGPFRESCGVDSLNGTNIRPLFLKQPVVDVTDIWYISNSLRMLERRLPDVWEVSFAGTRSWLYQFIPKKFQDITGPPSESMDTYLHVSRTRYDCNGVHKHRVLNPVAVDFSRRTDDWFFRKLMVNLRSSTPDYQQILKYNLLAGKYGLRVNLEDVCFDGGTASVGGGNSAFTITLRDVFKHKLSTRRVWSY